jgi:hypothetical protein
VFRRDFVKSCMAAVCGLFAVKAAATESRPAKAKCLATGTQQRTAVPLHLATEDDWAYLAQFRRPKEKHCRPRWVCKHQTLVGLQIDARDVFFYDCYFKDSSLVNHNVNTAVIRCAIEMSPVWPWATNGTDSHRPISYFVRARGRLFPALKESACSDVTS